MYQTEMLALDPLDLEAVVQFSNKQRARLDCSDGL